MAFDHELQRVALGLPHPDHQGGEYQVESADRNQILAADRAPLEGEPQGRHRDDGDEKDAGVAGKPRRRRASA